MVQHKAEPGPGVKGWDASLVIDCTPAQHDHLQKLIKESLSSGDWKSPRPELGEEIFLEGLPSWDFGVYQSELSNTLIDDRTGTGTLERACVVGGRTGASFAAQSKAAPTDTNFVMADGTKPKHQLQQTQSSGGRIGGPASGEVRSQNHVHMKTEAWAKTAEASGLGAARALPKPKYDLLELGKQMDDAIRRECFKEGTICFPVRKERKAIVALSMDFVVKNKWFCIVWKQRMKSWPGGW
jgi:hypothetical protein